MNLAGRAKVGLKIAALAPAFALGLPAQWLALRSGGALPRHLPVTFHRYITRVLGIRARIDGTPCDGPVLIVSNHTSWLDIVVLGSLMPLSFIAKSEVGAWPLFGTLARLQRTVFVDRQKKTATGAASRSIGRRLAGGDAMVLFAEGTTSDGGRVLPFRSALLGAARAALEDERVTVLVQPLSVIYTHRDGLPLGKAGRPFLAWYGDMDLVPHLAAILAGGPIDVAVSFGEPIPFAPNSNRKVIAALAETTVRMAARKAVTGRAGFDPGRETAKEE